jgi:hypothetical protein
LIFDIAEPGRSHGLHQSHREGTDWAMMVTYEENASCQQLTRHITTFRKVGKKAYRRGHDVHQLPREYPSNADYMVMADPDGNGFCVMDSPYSQNEAGSGQGKDESPHEG